MAATNRGASASGGNRQATRGRTRTQKTNASGRGSGRQTTARKSASGQSAARSGSASRSSNRSTASRTTPNRSAANRGAAAARSQTDTPSAASRNGQPGGNGARSAVARIGVPAVTGAIGIAGGVLLGRTALQRNKKVLGVPVPSKIDLHGVTHQIGAAGRQFGKLAEEVRKGTAELRNAREKAEQIARVLS
jgi:hypothetical protein